MSDTREMRYAIWVTSTGVLHAGYDCGGAWCGSTRVGGYAGTRLIVSEAEVKESGMGIRECLVAKMQEKHPNHTFRLCKKCF